MFFRISLYVSLAIFGFGLLFKISTWFRYKISLDSLEIPTSVRVLAASRGIVRTLFSVQVFILLKVIIVDIVLQMRILREDFPRWLMHICLYVGFTLLLLLHALDRFVTSPLFSEYYPTINPFMFFRDLLGALVLVGIAVAMYRRFIQRVPRLRTNSQDHYAIMILAVIMLSGVLLEGVKITSYTTFSNMVEEYTVGSDEEEVRALEAYWVEEFGMISPNVQGPFDEASLILGKEAHELTCLQCHSRPQWAFLGYTIAIILKPVALGLDRINMVTILWYLHFLACWVGLAYLPFSKMFHLFASPLSLMANAVMDREQSDPANVATRQVVELDACTHCCTCSLNCSVGVACELIPNLNILPSEKLSSVKVLAAGKNLSNSELRDIQEGVYLCTNCRRCTVVCPVGINLQDLWFNVRETLLDKGYPELLALSPLSYYRGLMREQLVGTHYSAPLLLAREAIEPGTSPAQETLPATSLDREFKSVLGLSDQASTFSVCFGCQTCTTVCPVVACYENPQEILGLLPHQIMHSCGLGLRDLAFGSGMLWDCLTCYRCLEECPQGVQVTDVLYELKNLAIRQAKEKLSDRT
jgi:heterodisulfide reductase subunit C/nitrate reductase gamma subunit